MMVSAAAFATVFVMVMAAAAAFLAVLVVVMMMAAAAFVAVLVVVMMMPAGALLSVLIMVMMAAAAFVAILVVVMVAAAAFVAILIMVMMMPAGTLLSVLIVVMVAAAAFVAVLVVVMMAASALVLIMVMMATAAPALVIVVTAASVMVFREGNRSEGLRHLRAGEADLVEGELQVVVRRDPEAVLGLGNTRAAHHQGNGCLPKEVKVTRDVEHPLRSSPDRDKSSLVVQKNVVDFERAKVLLSNGILFAVRLKGFRQVFPLRARKENPRKPREKDRRGLRARGKQRLKSNHRCSRKTLRSLGEYNFARKRNEAGATRPIPATARCRPPRTVCRPG